MHFWFFFHEKHYSINASLQKSTIRNWIEFVCVWISWMKFWQQFVAHTPTIISIKSPINRPNSISRLDDQTCDTPLAPIDSTGSDARYFRENRGSHYNSRCRQLLAGATFTPSSLLPPLARLWWFNLFHHCVCTGPEKKYNGKNILAHGRSTLKGGCITILYERASTEMKFHSDSLQNQFIIFLETSVSWKKN